MPGLRRVSIRLWGAVALAVSAAWLILPPALESGAGAIPSQDFSEGDLWLPPAGGSVPELGRAAAALPVFTGATADPLLGGYARLYQGRAELALDRPDAAMASAGRVL